MTSEQINIAIAEACGIISKDQWGSLYRTLHGIVRDCPDYCNDLHAIREAVMTLPENKQVLYGAHLAWACGHTDKGSVGLWKISTATARQRAEAFLRTLNLWKD